MRSLRGGNAPPQRGFIGATRINCRAQGPNSRRHCHLREHVRKRPPRSQAPQNSQKNLQAAKCKVQTSNHKASFLQHAWSSRKNKAPNPEEVGVASPLEKAARFARGEQTPPSPHYPNPHEHLDRAPCASRRHDREKCRRGTVYTNPITGKSVYSGNRSSKSFHKEREIESFIRRRERGGMD